MLLLGIELYIDVGANSIDEVKELGVDILNPVTFYKNFIIMNRGKVISCKAIDNLGNLILKVSEGNEEILITPHMDEVGLLVTNIERDGKIR
ncbi:MAG: hypothetical protein B6V02_01380 [Thermoprotei archaeon ex4572_64]|nr:MAG: hypothetical protein B6V02_01380 [Thermoprotei archaeon ex4572_64]